MNHLLSLAIFLVPLLSFGQLTGAQTSYSVQSISVMQEDSTTQLQDQLLLHITPDDLSDLSWIAVNAYINEEVPVMPEIQLGVAELQSSQYLTGQELIVPMMALDPGLTYKISVSLRNSAGEYLATQHSYYPN